MLTTETSNTVSAIIEQAEALILEKTGLKLGLLAVRSTSKAPEHAIAVIAAALNMLTSDYLTVSKRQTYVWLRMITAMLITENYPRLSHSYIAELLNLDQVNTIVYYLKTGQGYLDANDTEFTAEFNNAKNALDQWLRK